MSSGARPASNPYSCTAGPAKWAAIVILGAASIAGMAWSIYGRTTHPRLAPQPLRTPAAPPTGDHPATSSPDGGPPATPATASTSILRTIDLNTATKAELEVLPGIGPALAERIIADRTRRGPFKSVSDLDRVKGIGPKIIERLKPLVRV